ncbi:uncharacterized protein [Haliotis cracherodii]|uniref:uncharacterized protein n=1 Tax=Haliotis cracherodii TaxID=6455 RepID=UPI0039E84E5B
MPLYDLTQTLEKWAKKHSDFSEDEFNNDLSRLQIDTSKLRVINQHGPLDPEDVEKCSGVVFKSRYTNNSDVPQEHTFTMERHTDATVTTTLTKGFTTDGSVGIKVKVPDVITNATSSFGNEVTIATEDVSTVKHSVAWSIKSKVKVAPGKTTVAELRINEEKHKVNFKSTVIMKGRVLARVYRGDSEKPKVIESTLATILSDTDPHQAPDVRIEMETGKVTWDISGTLDFRFGVSQDCKVYPET